MNARRTMIRRLRDALRRRNQHKQRDDAPRTRISTAHWRRTHEVVHPERDLSEWVSQRAVRDWDSVVKGLNDK